MYEAVVYITKHTSYIPASPDLPSPTTLGLLVPTPLVAVMVTVTS